MKNALCSFSVVTDFSHSCALSILILKKLFYPLILHLRMSSSAGLDQTAPPDLHCLLRLRCWIVNVQSVSSYGFLGIQKII